MGTNSIADDTAVLLREDNNGITTLTLNRGNKFNALSIELLAALQAELDDIAADPQVRVVVLAAKGRAFCAGHDLKEMREDSSKAAMQDLFAKCAIVMTTITEVPQPVIARVQGIATAAGCQLVATCDLAVAADTARFATSGINVGLFCSTPMVAVTRNLPRKQAMEMLMTGDFIDAPTALQYGLLNRVVPIDDLDNAVAELAGKIAAKSAPFVARGKRLFYQQLEAQLKPAYDMAVENMACNMQSEDARDGIDAFIAKQPMPPWKDK